jgi:TPR repeat protein
MENNINPKHTLRGALNLFSEEDYDSCIDSIQHYANQGNTDACSCLGLAYQLGLGLDIDIEKAFYYLHKAAEAGLARAAHNLATLHATVPAPDIESSRFWFNKARELGFDPSTEKEL